MLFRPVRGEFLRVAGNLYSGGTSLRIEGGAHRGPGDSRSTGRFRRLGEGVTEILRSAERSSIGREPPNFHTAILKGNQTHTLRFRLMQTNLLGTARGWDLAQGFRPFLSFQLPGCSDVTPSRRAPHFSSSHSFSYYCSRSSLSTSRSALVLSPSVWSGLVNGSKCWGWQFVGREHSLMSQGSGAPGCTDPGGLWYLPCVSWL